MTVAPQTSTSASARTVGEQHLSADLAMDAVTLRVGDLELMSSYYENALALQPIEERARVGGEVHRVLGRGDVPFFRLIATPGLPGVDPSQAGLFHTAILFEDQASLAGTVLRARRTPAPASPAPATTSSLRPSTSPTPRATASSCTGIAPATSGSGRTARSRWTPCSSTRTSTSPST